MVRPKKCRMVFSEPNVTYFKPRGVPLIELEEVELTVEELEALRLKDLQGLEQTAAARKMKISQPTFHRVLSSARKKVSAALFLGKAIKINGGVYSLPKKQR